MGSLLPGWENTLPGVTPKEFTDYKDEEEQDGYFAAYERYKNARRLDDDLLGKSAPARMTSMPPNLSRRSSRNYSESSDAESPTWRTISAKFPEGSEMDSLRRASFQGGAGGLQRQSSLTRKGSLEQQRSPGGKFRSAVEKVIEENHKDPGWWSALPSGFLNDKPPMEDESWKQRQATPYSPQFGVTGQKMNYHLATREEGQGTEVH